MFNVREWPTAVQIELASDLQYVERAIREVMFFYEKRGSESSLEINIIIRIIRELLRNAIEHGNSNITSSRVFFTFEMVDSSLCRIIVEDEGEGFSDRYPDPVAEPHRARNRGLALVHELAEHLEFNDRGNKVSVLVRKEAEGETAGATGILDKSGGRKNERLSKAHRLSGSEYPVRER
jgi:anti-sigma regulatory factor (Ser/Thr protein kinase)